MTCELLEEDLQISRIGRCDYGTRIDPVSDAISCPYSLFQLLACVPYGDTGDVQDTVISARPIELEINILTC